LILIASVAWLSLATLEGTFARLIEYYFGYGALQFGFLFGYESLLAILVQGAVLAWILKRWKQTPLLRTAYVLQGVGLAMNPASAPLAGAIPPLATLFVASSLYALGSSVANPAVNGMCSRLAPDNRQGELFGLLQGTRSSGFVVGPMLGGILFDWHPAAPYLLAGGVCVAAALLVPRVD
jgi:MFS family permease